jgi:hypothetical protein
MESKRERGLEQTPRPQGQKTYIILQERLQLGSKRLLAIMISSQISLYQTNKFIRLLQTDLFEYYYGIEWG